MPSLRSSLSFLLLLTLCAPLGAQAFHVVDAAGGPGSRFTSIQAAIDAAAPGDTVLVRPGTYGEFELVLKPLHVVAGPGAPVRAPRATIQYLLPGDHTLVTGFDFDGAGPSSAFVQFCQGSVWFDDCRFASGLDVNQSRSVVVSSSEIDGPPHRAAVFGDHAGTMVLYDCDVRGSRGAQGGLPGVAAFRSDVFLSAGSVRGGDGMDAVLRNGECVPALPGGPAVLAMAGTAVRTLDVDLAGGDGGAGVDGSCPGAPPGPVLGGGIGTVIELPGAARGFTASSPLMAGGPLVQVFRGEPGDMLVQTFSFVRSLADFDPTLTGNLVSAAELLLPLGPLPPSGELTLVLHVPPGFPSATFFAQPAFVPATGPTVLGTPSPITILGP